MMCAGWIRFRASLMAIRRTSWIDQRINDGLAMLLSLPWFGVSFFLAVADWRDGGSPPSWRRRASPKKRGDATHAIHELAATQPNMGTLSTSSGKLMVAWQLDQKTDPGCSTFSGSNPKAPHYSTAVPTRVWYDVDRAHALSRIRCHREAGVSSFRPASLHRYAYNGRGDLCRPTQTQH